MEVKKNIYICQMGPLFKTTHKPFPAGHKKEKKLIYKKINDGYYNEFDLIKV